MFVIYGENVFIFEDGVDTSVFASCNYEEVDLRMMIYVFDVSLYGYRRIKIRSNDIDVVVFVVFIVLIFLLDELWILFGFFK